MASAACSPRFSGSCCSSINDVPIRPDAVDAVGAAGAFGGGVLIPTQVRYPAFALSAPISIGFLSRSCASVLGITAAPSW